MPEAYFTTETLAFLNELAGNNRRDWFQANKARYETHVRGPALAFIEDIAPALAAISPYFQAVARKSGGSLMRVYRDTRFARDKTPYKTNIGIQLRHEAGKDVHAPALYLHIEPDLVFLGAGAWHPDARALDLIRTAIDENGAGWTRARDDPDFSSTYRLAGDRLKRPPRGYGRDAPNIEDLKRKDYIAISDLDADAALSEDLLATAIERFAAAAPFLAFLCGAMGLRY